MYKHTSGIRALITPSASVDFQKSITIVTVHAVGVAHRVPADVRGQHRVRVVPAVLPVVRRVVHRHVRDAQAALGVVLAVAQGHVLGAVVLHAAQVALGALDVLGLSVNCPHHFLHNWGLL